MKTLDLNRVSECCHAAVVKGTQREYPLGGTTWHESYSIDVCENCGKEAESIEECGICGEVGCRNECESK